MNHVTMLGCAIVEATVLAAFQVQAQRDASPIPPTITPDAVGQRGVIAQGREAVGTSRVESTVLDATDTFPGAHDLPTQESAGTGTSPSAETEERNEPAAGDSERDVSPAAWLRAIVPSAFPGTSVCVINPDTGEITLVNLSEVAGPLLQGGGPESPRPPGPGGVGIAMMQSVCITPDGWLHGAVDTLRKTEALSRAVERLGLGPSASAHELAPIPEPTPIALLGFGPVLWVLLRRRKQVSRST